MMLLTAVDLRRFLIITVLTRKRAVKSAHNTTQHVTAVTQVHSHTFMLHLPKKNIKFLTLTSACHSVLRPFLPGTRDIVSNNCSGF